MAATKAIDINTTLPPPTLAIDRLRSTNWSGSIPIVLSLAPSSLSSPTLPAPIHVLLSRNTFLHVGLKDAVMRLHKFAPPTISFTKRVVEEPDLESSSDNVEGEQEEIKQIVQQETIYPCCWFEDEITELPLRWQFFAGILWDCHQSTTNKEVGLPWKIRLHFTSYPSSQLLELDMTSGVWTTVERTFKNALKQALVLEHGNAKAALNMSKQSHQRMWDSIVNSKYSIYKPIKDDIQASTNPVILPIRLLVGVSKPCIQKKCTDETTTLGSFLNEFVPEYFERSSDNGSIDIEPKMPIISWRIAGIIPPLSTLVLDLWRTLCHPDGFLYIAVLTE